MLKSQSELERLKATRRLGMNFGLGGALLGIICVALAFYGQNRKTNKVNLQLKQAYGELKETQLQLVKSEKMAAFGVMASRMAHEIQNPLHFVNNFSEMSLDLAEEINMMPGTEEKEESIKTLVDNLKKINAHGKRAAGIISRLQEHTRAGTAHEYFEGTPG